MDAIQLLSIVLGVAGLVGGGAGYFWKNRGETIIQLQAKEIDYWKNKAANEAADKDKALIEMAAVKKQNQDLIGDLGKEIRKAVKEHISNGKPRK